MTCGAKQSDACVSDGRQILRPLAGSHPAGVFSKRHVTDVVQFVLDAPVSAIGLQQFIRSGKISTNAGYRVRHFGRHGAADLPRPLDANCLCEAGPIKMSHQTIAGLKMTRLDATVTSVNGAALIKLRLPNALAVGGRGPD